MMPVLQRHWRRALRSIGPSGLAALLFLAIGILVAGSVPRLDRESAQTHQTWAARTVDALTHPRNARPDPTNADRLAQYLEAFPERSQNAADLAAIFSSAQRHDVLLLKGEYQLKVEADSPFVSYSATFPVRTGYGSIKEFAADVLRVLPHASLDELRISRDGAGADVLDSVVRFTLTYRSR